MCRHAISVGRRFGIVRDHHNCLAEVLIELPQQREHGFGAFRIEISRGLISEYNFRLADNRARQSHTLLFAAGKFRGFVPQPLFQAQQTGNSFEAVRVETVSMDVLREGNIVIRIERRQQIKSLEHEADFVAAQQGSRGVAHFREVIPIEQHAPPSGLSQASNHVQKRGFTATRRPHDGNEFAGKNGNADAAKRRDLYLARAIHFP